MVTTTTAGSKLVFQLFAGLAEFERRVGGDFSLVPPLIGPGVVPDKSRFRHDTTPTTIMIAMPDKSDSNEQSWVD